MKVSFVIPAHNEEPLIAATLESIHAAARAREVGLGDAYEIVVADDASTDQTAAIASELGARVIPTAVRQIAGARNAGARAARGKYLVFVDADTQVNPAVVRATVEALDHGAVGGGCCVRFDPPVPRYARFGLALVMVLMRILRAACGAYLFCTREAWEAVGGFDATLFASEETVISKALRRRGRFVFLHRVHVVTSGRKVRTYTQREILGLVLKFGLTGKRRLRRREGLEIWYGPRREES